ncbi:MAG: OmpA family protein [Deltaproteobacteria bacterium]|nr:OmpA family protein [Deltaproteobacteria bacterium]
MMSNSAAGGLPLDTLPLEVEALKRVQERDEAQVKGLEDRSSRTKQRTMRDEAGTDRSRRPLARFADTEEPPSFYLSMSDLMSMLLVFFVLIFSLSEGGTPLPSDTKPGEHVAQAAVPATANASEPFPLPEPLPRDYQEGIALVQGRGQVDPGLAHNRKPAAPPAARLALGQGGYVDRRMLTLVSQASTLPAEAVPAVRPVEPQGGALVGEVRPPLPAGDGGPAGLCPEADDPVGALAGRMRGLNCDGVEVVQTPESVILRLPEAITFDSGSTVIRTNMLANLERLAQILADGSGGRVRISGHTDDVPIHNDRFASNWELSAARAAQVARALLQRGLDPARVTILGLADQEPLAPNDTWDNRQMNRRVEIAMHLDG